MGDMGDDFRAMRQRSQRAKGRHESEAADALTAQGIPHRHVVQSSTFVVRGRRNADYYPTRHRWIDTDTGKRHSGFPSDFVAWYVEGRVDG